MAAQLSAAWSATLWELDDCALISRMEAAGLVSRHRAGGDARSVTVVLTDAGHALRDEAGRIQCSLLEKLDLPAEDLLELRRLARNVVAALERADAT